MKNFGAKTCISRSKFTMYMVIAMLIFTFMASLLVIPENTYAADTQDSYDLNVGNTIKITIADAPKKCKWYVNKKGIVSISSNGVIKGKKAGKVIVKVKKGKKTYYSFSVKVTDVKPTVDNIKVSSSLKNNIVKVTTINKNKTTIDYEIEVSFYKDGKFVMWAGMSCYGVGYKDKEVNTFDSVANGKMVDFDDYKVKITHVKRSKTRVEYNVETSVSVKS